MRIGVDARSLTLQPTGVAHYLLGAVNVWASTQPQVEFVLLAHKPLHPSAANVLVDAPNVSFVQTTGHFFRSNGSAWLLTHFALAAVRCGATHLWGPGGVLPITGSRGLPTLLTVHDLVYKSLPQTMALKVRFTTTLLTGMSIRRADLIWAVSHFTSAEVDKYFPKRRSSHIFVGSGLNPLRRSMELKPEFLAALAQKYRISDKTLLFVGTLEPRKNIAFLLSLMPRLALFGVNLLVVGCSGWGRTGISEVLHAKNFPTQAVHFCDYLSDTELQGLYQLCAFFISTALMEGFGLPQLEALAAGCPVIGAKNSAVMEVVGDGGVLVSGWHVDDWISSIHYAFANAPSLRAAARVDATRHSFDTVTQEVTNRLSTV